MGIEKLMKNKKGSVPPICKICEHREANYCSMLDVDVTTESWLREFDGCNQQKDFVPMYKT